MQRLLQVRQLLVHCALGLLCILDSLRLIGLDRLDLLFYVVGLGRKTLDALFDLIDDCLVLQLRAVEGKVDVLRRLGQDLNFPARIIVALLEGAEGGGGLAFEAELGADLGPVDFEGCAALFGGKPCP